MRGGDHAEGWAWAAVRLGVAEVPKGSEVTAGDATVDWQCRAATGIDLVGRELHG